MDDRKFSISKIFRSGLGILIPSFILVYLSLYLCKALANVSKSIFGIKSVFIGTIVFVAVVLLAGLVAEQTTIVDRIEKIVAKNPLVLRVFNFLFGRRNTNGLYEIYFYLSPLLRARGIVTAEYSDESGKWLVVNFSSPPTPGLGTTLFEIRADDPRIVRTGRTLAGYAAYIISYGTSDRNGNSPM